MGSTCSGLTMFPSKRSGGVGTGDLRRRAGGEGEKSASVPYAANSSAVPLSGERVGVRGDSSPVHSRTLAAQLV